MSEYIIYESEATETIDYLGVKHRVTHHERREEIVRCRDCKHYSAVRMANGTEEHRCSGVMAFVNCTSDGFCAWGEKANNFKTCKCGEDIELGERESAVCPRCKRTVRA